MARFLSSFSGSGTRSWGSSSSENIQYWWVTNKTIDSSIGLTLAFKSFTTFCSSWPMALLGGRAEWVRLIAYVAVALQHQKWSTSSSVDLKQGRELHLMSLCCSDVLILSACKACRPDKFYGHVWRLERKWYSVCSSSSISTTEQSKTLAISFHVCWKLLSQNMVETDCDNGLTIIVNQHGAAIWIQDCLSYELDSRHKSKWWVLMTQTSVNIRRLQNPRNWQGAVTLKLLLYIYKEIFVAMYNAMESRTSRVDYINNCLVSADMGIC